MVVLHELLVHAGSGQQICAIGFHEEPARVLKDARLDQEHTGKGRFYDFQARPQAGRAGKCAAMKIGEAKGRL
jgi:hypothetical protein